MWTLWVISTIIDSTEPKYTRYAEYESAMSCHIQQAVLETTFTEGETAICTEE